MSKRSTLEKKELYTEEDLLNHTLSYEEREEKLLNSLYSIMFERCGKSYAWAKEHDYEDLHVIDIVFMKDTDREEMDKVFVDIMKRQLHCGKRQAEKEVSIFEFMCGVSNYSESEDLKFMSLDKCKETLRHRIEQYEKKNGELHYSDGYENELKEFAYGK